MLNANMKSSVAKKEIESALSNRFGATFQRCEKRPIEILPTGVEEIDALLSGIPRGAITEIVGTASSGRTSLLLSVLAEATTQAETCALIDTSDTFDPSSAANAKIDFDSLLWVRCSDIVEHAFKATDLLLQSGGFGLVVLNLTDVAAKHARRIISSWWFRFRRAIESTPTALVVITSVCCVRSCAALILDVKSEGAFWPGAATSRVDNSSGISTTKKDGERSREKSFQLSLVAGLAQQVGCNASLLTHSLLLGGMYVRVAREKPVFWAGGPGRFSTRLSA